MALESSPVRVEFRAQAVEAYLEGEPDGGILCVAPPRTWLLFWILCAVVAAAALGSAFGHVELTSRGRGILRPAGGVRPLTTPIAGTVAQVFVASGATVTEGQVVARLESAGLEVELHETEDRLSLAKADVQRFSSERSRLFDERAALLAQEAELVRRRIRSQDETIGRLEPRVRSFDKLRENGLVTADAQNGVREQLEEARRQRLGLEEALSKNALQLASINETRKDELWRLEQAAQGVQARRDALALALMQTEVRAPQAGVMEAVLVRPGDLVVAGAPIGKVLPSRLPSQIVSFLSEKDRAFVQPGQLVRVEVDQLPYSEFGPLTAQVERIAEDLAAPYEVRDAFGEAVQVPGATFRVELTLTESPTLAELSPRLRPGMLVDVRYALRSRRIITLILDPLRRWWR